MHQEKALEFLYPMPTSNEYSLWNDDIDCALYINLLEKFNFKGKPRIYKL